MSYDDVRREIHAACRRLEAEGLVAGSSGNVSVRLPDERGEERYAITPSSVPYRLMQPEQVLVIDGKRELIDGEGRPSTETLMHLAAYRARPDVGAVIHSHSVYASALAVAGQDLPALIDEQVVTLGGPTVCAEWGMSGSDDLGSKAAAALSYRAAVLLRSHGVLSVGRTLDEVIDVASLVERMAKVYVLARSFGAVERLPQNVEELEIKFYKMQHGLPVDE